MFLNRLLPNVILPFWAKYIAYGVLAVSLFSFGYVKGLGSAYKESSNEVIKVITLQGKTTTKVVTKYIKIKEKQAKKDEEIVHEGQGYAIKFPNDSYHFNNWYVRMHDASVTGTVPPLSSGVDGDSSGVSVSRHLQVSLNNNIVGRQWQLRAETCEAWAKEQEELN